MIKSWEYIKALFRPSDIVSIMYIHHETGKVVNNFLRAEQAASLKYQKRMRYMNANGYSVYICMNPLKEPEDGNLKSLKRNKENIKEIRHIFIEIDEAGKERIEQIKNAVKNKEVPQPNFILESSPGKYQVVWNVEGLSKDEAENYNRYLVKKFGGDPAATDCSRVLRVTGFRNKKYPSSPLVTGEKYTSKVYSKKDFKFTLSNSLKDEVKSISKDKKPVVINGKFSQSEADWIYCIKRIENGDNLENIKKDLIRIRQDKPNPEYYAKHTVEKAERYVFIKAQIKEGVNPEQLKRNLPGEFISLVDKAVREVGTQKILLRTEHHDILKAIGRLGVIGYEHLKNIPAGYRRTLELKKAGLIEQVSAFAVGRKDAVYILTPEGAKFVKDKYGISYSKKNFSVNPSTFPHQLKLADVYFSKSRMERESWKTETEIYREIKQQIKEGKLKGIKEIDCPDASYVNSKGVRIAVEVITKNYRQGQIENKRQFAEKIFGKGNYEEYKA